eukprot:UN05999
MTAHVTGVNVFYANLDIDSKKVLWKYRHTNKNLSKFNDMALNAMKFAGDTNLLWRYIGAVDNPARHEPEPRHESQSSDTTNKRKRWTSSLFSLPSFPEYDELSDDRIQHKQKQKLETIPEHETLHLTSNHYSNQTCTLCIVL